MQGSFIRCFITMAPAWSGAIGILALLKWPAFVSLECWKHTF